MDLLKLMIKQIIYVLILLCFAGNSISQTKASPSKKRKKCFFKQTKYIVSGKVTQTFTYCGGAMPTQEILDKLATPIPFPKKNFYIRKGNMNTEKAAIIMEFMTDENGNFSLQLAPGIYSIIQEAQAKPLNLKDYLKENIKVDDDCLKAWWAKPYYLLEIKNDDITELNFTFHHPCFISGEIPCMRYTGPMPP